MLMGIAALPRLNRLGRRGSLQRRLRKMHAIATMYDPTEPTCPIDIITLKAMVEPRIMRERRLLKMRVAITAFRGISHPGRTCKLLALHRMWMGKAHICQKV